MKGFGVYYVENNEISVVNFNVITNDDDNQSMVSVVRALRLLREQPFFKQIESTAFEIEKQVARSKYYILWADCG